MMDKSIIRTVIFVLVLSLFFPSALPIQAETFFGESATGLIELENSTMPVFLYVPENYKPENVFPLVISLPERGENQDEHLKEWSTFGKRRSVIILFPFLEMRDNDVPYRVDEWLKELKNDILQRYHIEKDKVYLVGEGDSAHYAAYLGVKYPEEFSGIGLINGSWVGTYEPLIKLQGNPARQIPFFISLKSENEELIKATEEKAYQLQNKGYPIYFERLEASEDFATREFKERLFGWLEEKSQSWQEMIQKGDKPWKERFQNWLAENYFVK